MKTHINNMKQKVKVLFWHRHAKTNSKGLAPIYARITINGERIQFSTGVYVKKSDFDIKTKKIKSSGNINNDYYTNRLNLIEVKINKMINDLVLNNIDVTKENVKFLIAGGKASMLKNNNVAPKFIELCNKYIDKKLVYNEDLTAKYKRFTNNIQKYVKKNFGQKDVNLSLVRLGFVDDLYFYLKNNLKYGYDTTNKYVSFVKRMLDFAVLNDYLETNPIKAYKCESYGRKKDILFLSEDELLKIYNHSFDNPTMEKVKNLFLFQCFTGLAYGDMYNLTPSNIRPQNNRYWIIKERQKTGVTSNIPMLPETLEILTRIKFENAALNDRLINCITNQSYNKYLKVLSVETGISILLTSHIARKTFATIILNKSNVSIESVAKMLGHANTRVTQSTYSRILNSKIESEIQDFSFINSQTNFVTLHQ